MAQGAATVVFEAQKGRTVLGEVYQSDPLRLLFPDSAAGEPLTGALVTTSGGLVGGDQLSIRARSGARTAGRVMAQAAEKIYRSLGSEVEIEVDLQAAEDSWLEWLPQETIVFESARLRRVTRLEVAVGARVLCGEMLAFGRAAMGEDLTDGMIHEAWEVRCEGHLVWSDVLHLEQDLAATLKAPACFDGARAGASVLYVGEDASEHLETARDMIRTSDDSKSLYAWASCVGPVLIVRWLGCDGATLRRAYGHFWATFRHHVAGYPPIMPRLWEI